ncbi:MAG: copper amine oxidase N-terminal domain-containing protein [Clostridia bacterium]|nr:copper amine oxidase N-terminal domain-containing protein [Clostridia bacterium]
MKRIVAAILLTVMLLTMVGCSSDEIGMYGLMKETMLLDTFETTGTVSFQVQGQWIEDFLKKSPKDLKSIKNIFNPGIEIRYDIKQNKKTSEYEVAMEFRFKDESNFRKLTTVIGNKKVAYVKMNDLLEFLRPYIAAAEPSKENALNEIIAKVEYLEVDIEKGTTKGIYKKGYSGTVQDEKLTKVFIGFIDIFKEAFQGFSSGLVTKKSNGYEFSIGPRELQQVTIKFVEYFANNIDTIADKAKEKVKSLSEDELKTLSEGLGKPALTREELLEGLDEMREDVKESSPRDLEKMKTDESFNKAIQSMEGSNLSYYVGKLGDGKYESSTSIKIKYEDKLSIDILEKDTIQKLSSFAMVKPANTVSEEELKAIVEKIIPPTVTEMRINIDSGDAQLRYSNKKTAKVKMEILQKDGYTYLPLRTLTESFGENASWDDTRKNIAVDSKGIKVYLEGLYLNGKPYVKTRELKKLGYFVLYNDRTKETIIGKSYSSSLLY